MKKYLFLIILSIANVLISYAQEKAFLKVNYNFEHLRDTVSGFRYKEEMGLLVGKTVSSYYSQRKLTQDSVKRKAYEQADQNGGYVNLGVILPTTMECYFIFHSDKKLLIATPFQRDLYLINEPLETIKWSINSRTKNIKGFLCQQAVGSFKGRLYTVWFTSELPTNAGPWKLNGLPGLILEAADSKNEVSFIVKSIQKTPGQNIIIPTNGIKTNLKDFNKMTQAYSNGGINPNSTLANSDIKINGQNLSGSSSKKSNTSGINNPMEKSN
ncbi:MAG: GLPGLI family protein [Sphingobacteriia bacterium]|jgi:GLPGLI family protein